MPMPSLHQADGASRRRHGSKLHLSLALRADEVAAMHESALDRELLEEIRELENSL
jgi:hypothetical protein